MKEMAVILGWLILMEMDLELRMDPEEIIFLKREKKYKLLEV